MKRVILFTFQNNIYLNSVVEYFSGKNVEFEIVAGTDYSKYTNAKIFDLCVIWGYEGDVSKFYAFEVPVINVHPSLLPKFNTDNAIFENFSSKDKYGGVSIHYLNSEKYITQESFWKEDGLSFEDFKSQVFDISSRLLPRVIEGILYKKINVLILTDNNEPLGSLFYDLLSYSNFVNRLFIDDLKADFIQKYSDIDLVLFDTDIMPQEKTINMAKQLGATPVVVMYNLCNNVEEKNIYIWDGKNLLEFFNHSKELCLENKEIKQIIIDNFNISSLSDILDDDFGELLIKVMLEKLDYTFLHWKK